LDFQAHGTAALLAPSFRLIRPDPTPGPVQNGPGMTDPGELGELVRRLEEVVTWLRTRSEPAQREGVARFGSVEVELATQVIRRGGVRVAVTRTEFRLLYALLRRPLAIVSRAELAAEVWGPEVRLRSRVVDTHIARLRRKLEADPAHPRHILTSHYLGYRFDPRGG
jgi:two-component system, OmpR family, KDP operon response regulator KdpE